MNRNGAYKLGFTLIEAVVGVGIFALLSLLGTTLLMASLRGVTKARTAARLRSEGATALEVMGRFIRYGQKVSSCAADGSSLTLVNLQGETTTFTCQAEHLASNSARLTSPAVRVTSCTAVFTCDAPPPLTRLVLIKFRLTPTAPLLLPEFSSSLDFQSQIGLRN